MSNSIPNRRGFLSRLAAGTAALAAAAGLPRIANAESAPTRDTHELDKWIDDLKGQHKQVYDCTTAARVGDIVFATNFLTANVSDYGLKDEDLSSIVSFRHEATLYAFNDAMWEKYKIGEVLNVPQRGAGGRGGRGNPPADSTAARPDSTVVPPRATSNPQMQAITRMAGRGIRFTVCSLATRARAGSFARSTSQKVEDVQAELFANLVPNCRPVAAGVVIINRAQEKGFTLCYVG